MVLFSAKHPSEVKEAHCEELRALGFPIDSCVDPLPAFAAEAPEGPAADAPPDGAGALDDDERSGELLLHANDSEDKVPERVIKLRDQAMSLERRLFHFPKNPFCDICNQARMLSRRVRRKPRDSEVEPDPLEASEFGEVIAADHIHVFRSPDDSDASDKSSVVLCLRDKYTGLFAAFPGNDRSTNAVVVALRKFVGRRVCSKPVTLVSDAADENSKPLPRRWDGFPPPRCPIDSRIMPSLKGKSGRSKKEFVRPFLKRVSRFVLSCGLLHVVLVPWQ